MRRHGSARYHNFLLLNAGAYWLRNFHWSKPLERRRHHLNTRFFIYIYLYRFTFIFLFIAYKNKCVMLSTHALFYIISAKRIRKNWVPKFYCKPSSMKKDAKTAFITIILRSCMPITMRGENKWDRHSQNLYMTITFDQINLYQVLI